MPSNSQTVPPIGDAKPPSQHWAPPAIGDRHRHLPLCRQPGTGQGHDISNAAPAGATAPPHRPPAVGRTARGAAGRAESPPTAGVRQAGFPTGAAAQPPCGQGRRGQRDQRRHRPVPLARRGLIQVPTLALGEATR